MNAIELTDVFKLYASDGGNRAALQGLSLSVRERELVVVLGPSGSGKSTLLRLLAGLETPSAGSVRVFGAELASMPPRERAGLRTATVGYADQHYSRALSPELSARELVALPLALRGVPRSDRFARADELLDRVGLGARRNARPAALSGGEQQRVALCAAVAHRPRVLLADEPTGELDHANAAEVYRLLGELARTEHCTSVIVSHDPESADIADRVVQVRDGRVSAETVRETTAERESIVVARGGWLRLPEELLRRTGIASRAQASLEDGGILVRSTAGPAPVTDGLPPNARTAATPSVGIELRGVTKRLGRGAAATTVFDGFDCSFGAGELTVVTGPSGSGKTTLLSLIAGLTLPDAGEVVVEETDVARLGRAERAAFRASTIALVAQDAPLVPFLRAHENVELALALRGWEPDAAARAATEALETVGLVPVRAQRTERLSAGERERVAIARALAARPAVLLADEPTARLDEANAREIASRLAAWARDAGSTVVCATHDRVLVEQADRELRLGALRPARQESQLVPAN